MSVNTQGCQVCAIVIAIAKLSLVMQKKKLDPRSHQIIEAGKQT